MKQYLFATSLLVVSLLGAQAADPCNPCPKPACPPKPVCAPKCAPKPVCAPKPDCNPCSDFDYCDMFKPLGDLSVSTTVGFESEYIYRGAKLAQENITSEAVMEYALFGGGAYASAWHMSPFKFANTRSHELDLTLGYNHSLWGALSCLTMDGGFTYYYYANTKGTEFLNREREIFLGLSLDWYLDPSLYAYYDFDRSQFILELSGSHSFDLNNWGMCSGFSFDVAGHIAYLTADDYLGNQRVTRPKVCRDFFYGQIRGDLVYHFTDYCTMGTGIRFAFNTDGKGPNGANALGGHNTLFWWGSYINFSM